MHPRRSNSRKSGSHGSVRGRWLLARRALQFIAASKCAVVGVLALALVLAAANAGEPLVMRFLLDALGRPDAQRVLPTAVGALLALEIVRALMAGWLKIVTWDVRLSLDFSVRERIVAKLTSLPLSYHQRKSVGGTMTRINQGIAGFVNAFGELAFNILPTLVYFALSLIAMVRMDWRLTMVVLAFAPIPALVGSWAAREQTRRERRLVTQWTRIYSRLNEVLVGIRTVKVFAREHEERHRFLAGQQRGNDIVRRGIRTDSTTEAIRGLGATLARLAAIGLGGVFVIRGQITIGTLVAFLGYIGGLFGPVQGLTNIYQTVRRGTVSLELIFDVLDAEDPVEDAPDAIPAPRLRGEVCFRDVSFAYEPARPVIRNVTLQVQAGELLAIVGPSGGGKTTLMSLLQRLFPVTEGRITVDGQDIRSLTQHSVRRQIGVVSQDMHLFNEAVRSNIAYGRPGASELEIETVARAANAHEFIQALPRGYDTVVGEGGSCLSGGERQRIAIARALLIDPPILILDEATSALDQESESLVQQALVTLTRGRTTFVIAHRLATVVKADRIVVLRDGEILEIGAHEALVRAGGYYAAMVSQQANGFLIQHAA